MRPSYIHTVRRSYADCGGAAVKKGLVIGAYDGCSPGEVKYTRAAKAFDEKLAGKISQLIKGGVHLPRGSAQVFSNLGDEFHSVALAGLGEEGAGYNSMEILDECKENIRWASGTGARALQDAGITQIYVEPFENAEAAAEGAGLAIWQYQDMRNPADHKPNPKLELYESSDIDSWKRGIGKADCQNLARRLEEAPGNLMTPTIFAQWTLDALCPCGIQVEVRDRDWLETNKMSALLAVSKGSCEEPVLLEIGYCGGKGEDKPITIVSKGITFDSGGLCLKECAKMHEKRGDIAGAAVCVGAIKCAAMMALPINIKVIAPVMETMMGGSSVKPGDVISSINGKTVCIENPDNEGRVSMIDPLVFCHTYYPCLIGSVASLTGMTTRGLGSACSAFFTTSNDIWREMERAGSETGDRVWRMPFWKYFTEKVTGYPSIDVNNVGKGGGQPCLGAAFLKEFISPDLDFMHMDIHGTGLLARGPNFPYLRPGLMTGRPVRTIAQFFYQVACPHDKGDHCS